MSDSLVQGLDQIPVPGPPPSSQVWQPQPSPVWQPSAPPASPPQASWVPPQTSAAPVVPGQPRRALADLVDHLDQQPRVKASGWRGRLGLGPSQADVELAEDRKVLRAVFPRPVSIAVATPKGGAGKTPTAIGLGAAFGLDRGGSVVVWDNNELRGTLSYRTFRSHALTVVDLLRDKDFLLRPDSRIADIQHYLNWQPTGQFWVLASSREKGKQISEDDFHVVWRVLSRFFGLVIIDTGNNEAASSWQEAVYNADCVVVPIKWSKDDLILAAAMVEGLEKEGREAAGKIVLVGTNAPAPRAQIEEQARIRTEATQWFAGRPMVEIPPDAHIASGAEIDWDLYGPATRRAYQRLGATDAREIMRSLSRIQG